MIDSVLDVALGASRLSLFFVGGLFLPVLLQLLLLFAAGWLFVKLAGKALGKIGYLLLLVGTPVHELSHAIARTITFCRVTSIELLIDPVRGMAETISSRPNVLGNVLSPLAPLLGGILVLWLTASYVIPGFEVPTVAPPQLDPQSAASFGTALKAALAYVVEFLGAAYSRLPNLQWDNWRTYVGMYIALSVGLSIAPSKQDLKNLAAGLLLFIPLILGLFALLYLSGNAEGVFLTLQEELLSPLLGFTAAVTYAFVLTSAGLVLVAVLAFLRAPKASGAAVQNE